MRAAQKKQTTGQDRQPRRDQPSYKDDAKNDLKGKPYSDQVQAITPDGEPGRVEESTYVDAYGKTIHVTVQESTYEANGVEHEVRLYVHHDEQGNVVKMTRVTEYTEGDEEHSTYEFMDPSGKVLYKVSDKRKKPMSKDEQALRNSLLTPEAAEKEQAKRRQTDFEKELKKQYVRQFGKKLGKKLYDVVTKGIGPDALMGYAKKGLASAISSLGDLTGDEKAKAEFQKVVGPKAKELAAILLDGVPAVQDALTWLSNHMREHPYGLMSMALITAVLVGMKAYADNVDIPEFKQMFKVSKDLKIGASVDLGKVQELTVDSLHGYLDLHVSRFNMSLDIGHEAGKDGDSGEFTVQGKGAVTLLETSEKEIDETTKQLKRSYASKLSATFGSSFKYDEKNWSLEALELTAGLAFEARDKQLVDKEELDRLQRSEYKEKILKVYANYLQRFKEVDGGSLGTEEVNLALGLSMVMKKTVEIKATQPDGSVKEYKLEPMSWGFNWGINYKNRPMDINPTESVGIEGGIKIEKGNWSLGASVGYTQDLIKNRGGVEGKITFSLKF